MKRIISYQVITGNYNIETALPTTRTIISYQVITGNYNLWKTMLM